jgi:hypothetical protein
MPVAIRAGLPRLWIRLWARATPTKLLLLSIAVLILLLVAMSFALEVGGANA